MHSTHTSILLLILGPLLAACPDTASMPSDATDPPDATVPDVGPKETELSPLVEVCPRGDGTPVIGDSNGDGVSDIADAVALQNHLFRGGPAPVCLGAANFDGDTRVEMDDAERVSMYLLTGKQIPRVLRANECVSATYWPEGECAPLALDLRAPLRVTTDRFRAELVLRSPVLPVQAFSLSLEATDCEVAKVTAEETTAAEVWDRPAGIRHLGWATTTPVDGGAIAYLILSFTDDIYFPMSEEPTSILSAEIEATPPSSGCRTCRVSVRDGLVWKGQPINTTIAANGRAYVPALPSIEVEVCAE